MKKKEILIIFLLVILVMGGSWFASITFYIDPFGIRRFRGLPLSYWDSWYGIKFGFLLFDFLFWFLVLAVGWWVVRRLKGRKS